VYIIAGLVLAAVVGVSAATGLFEGMTGMGTGEEDGQEEPWEMEGWTTISEEELESWKPDASWSPYGPGDCFEHSLRIITYNTQFLPWLVTKYSAENDILKARMMCGRIIKAGADVVVLNEVFDEDARGEFETCLSAVYPHFVSKMDKVGDLEDSGLMLFSRYPLGKFNQAPMGQRDPHITKVTAENQGIPFDAFFYLYTDAEAATAEDVTAKGVGLVRVHVPCANKHVTIGFTHMQASYDPPGESQVTAEVRDDQMDHIRKLIEGAVGKEGMKTEEVYLLGDLNIDGNLHSTGTPIIIGGMPEWNYHFARPGSFFFDPMFDGWAYGTSDQDPGQTSGVGFPYFPDPGAGERFDYLLHNKPEVHDAPMCLQHIRLARELALPQGKELSDHLGVFADINRFEPGCGPTNAHMVNITQTTTYVPGTLVHPGAMQWYLVTKPGSFSFEVKSPGPVELSVYEEDDLTRPIRDFYGEVTEWGRRFEVLKPPFYIRVYSPDRGFAGSFDLTVHQHTGDGPEDAISLYPYMAKEKTYPSMPLPYDTAMWFVIKTGLASNGTHTFPQLQFLLKEHGAGQFDFKLVDKKGAVQGHSRSVAPGTVDDYTHAIGHSSLALGNDNGIYYVRVLPQASPLSNNKFKVEFRTTLTTFIACQLVCESQTDTVGDDEMYYYYGFDGWGMPGYEFVTHFDTGEPHGMRELMPEFRFVNSVGFSLAEDDNDAVDADDYYHDFAVSYAHQPAVQQQWGCKGHFETWPVWLAGHPDTQPFIGQPQGIYHFWYTISNLGERLETLAK